MSTDLHTQIAVMMSGILGRAKPLQEKWLSVHMRLASMAHRGAALHNDYWIDLLLREMEAETADQLAKVAINTADEEPIFDHFEFANQMQSMLTRLWVLSAYELLRSAKSSEHAATVPKILQLYERFRLIRIPLAKGQIAADHKLKEPLHFVVPGDTIEKAIVYEKKKSKNYVPVQLIDRTTGSIGWGTVQPQPLGYVTLTRLELSDQLLSVCD